MKLHILASQYEYYNANDKGKSTGDCVKRSISLAFNKPYRQVSRDLVHEAQRLNQEAKEKRQYNKHYVFNSRLVENNVIKGYGGSDFIRWDLEKDGPYITVSEFADANNGSYVVSCAKDTKNEYSTHAVAVINNTIYDSWDSTNWYVKAYYIANGTVTGTDIKDHFADLATYAQDKIHEVSEKWIRKWDMPGALYTDGSFSTKGYSMKFNALYTFRYEPDHLNFLKPYDESVVFSFTPNETMESAKQKIDDIVKDKYHRDLYGIRKDINEKLEAKQLAEEAGLDPNNPNNLYIIDGREERFYNSLPTWVKPFITYMEVSNPGQWSDSYKLKIKPLPRDPRKSDHPTITFENYNAAPIKDMLDRYKKNYEVPGEDYEPYEEY